MLAHGWALWEKSGVSFRLMSEGLQAIMSNCLLSCVKWVGERVS